MTREWCRIRYRRILYYVDTLHASHVILRYLHQSLVSITQFIILDLDRDDIDVSRKNWEGLTPLGVANMNGRVQAAELIKNNYIFEHKSSSSSSEAAIAANENGSSDDLVRLREEKCWAKVTRRIHPSALPSRPLMFEQRMKQERHETELKLRTVSAKTIQAWWRRRAEILLSSKR